MCPTCGATRVPQAVVCGKCGHELIAADKDPLIGVEVGSYRVLGRLGIGGMGTVYAAVEKNIDKKVAIKIVHPHLTKIPDLPTLLAEAKAVNAIGDRGVVDIHGFGELPDGRQYLVMELLEGESLDAFIRRRRELDLDELVQIGDGILGALEGAHAAGFLHRDIKPANVFIVRPSRGDPYVKLLDFGLALKSRTAAQLALGTPAYAAPEQALAGTTLGPSADLYAVGCVLFEMAAGQMPFPDPDPLEVMRQHTTAERPHVRVARPSLPAALDALICSLMAIDPAQRPASAAEVRLALQALVPKKRSKAWIAAAAGLVAAVAVAGWSLTRPAPAAIAVADPLEASVHRIAEDVRKSLAGGEWELGFQRLSAAERALPGRKEWAALRGESRAAVRSAASQALERADVDGAEKLLELAAPNLADDPLVAAIARARFAGKNGMVRVGALFVDAYEYPNRAGALPETKVDWPEAVKLCATAGKHLCSEDEWQHACTSFTRREFPYGDQAALERCHHKGKLKNAVPAGAMAACVSPEGVHDLSGNVAEWTSTALREGAPQKVIRGGSFQQSDKALGCSARDYYLPGLGGAKYIGFRCCL